MEVSGVSRNSNCASVCGRRAAAKCSNCATTCHVSWAGGWRLWGGLVMLLLTLIPPSKAGMIRDLSAIPGVRSAQLEWTCEGRCGVQILQYYETDTRIATQSPMSVLTGERSLLVERLAPNTNYTFDIYDELDPEFMSSVDATTLAVQLEKMRCAPKQIEISIYTGPVFGGIIYVGGHYNLCNMTGDASRDVELYTLIIPLDECANKLPNHHYETTVIVQEHLSISTGNDLAMSISCDYTPPKEKRVTSGMFEVTDDPSNEAISDIDRTRLILEPQANREKSLSASLRQRHIEETIETERVEDEVIYYNIAAVVSIALGVGFMLAAGAICYCRYKEVRRREEKQSEAERGDPRCAVMYLTPPTTPSSASMSSASASTSSATSSTTSATSLQRKRQQKLPHHHHHQATEA